MLGVCIQKKNIQSCTNDTECDDGKSCVEGECAIVDSCISLQCQQEEFCQEGICLRDNNNSFIPCTQDVDCHDGYICFSLDICIDPHHPLYNCSGGLSCGSKAQCENDQCAQLPGPGKTCDAFRSEIGYALKC